MASVEIAVESIDSEKFEVTFEPELSEHVKAAIENGIRETMKTYGLDLTFSSYVKLLSTLKRLQQLHMNIAQLGQQS